MKSIYGIEYKNGLCLDIHLPDGEEYDLFVYFHGGGLTRGSRGGVEVFADTLAKRGIATASVEYRLMPDAQFPDFIEDAADAIRWLLDHAAEFGRMKRIFVGGSSAGGYISMMLCFDERYLGRVGLKPTDITAYIHDAGQPTAHYNVLKSRGIDPKRVIVDEIAPLYFVGMAEKYSPMLFIVSDDDMVGRYEQTKLMVRTLGHFGHSDGVSLRVMRGKHCEYVYKKNENGDGVLGVEILAFLDKIFGA